MVVNGQWHCFTNIITSYPLITWLESEHPWKIPPTVAMEVNVVRENQRTQLGQFPASPRLIDGILDVHFPEISKYAM